MKNSGWSKVDLASVVSTLESGSRPKGGVSTDSGEIASLGGENIIQSGGVTLADVKRVPLSFYKQMTKGHLVDGDVLINKDGAQTGKVGLFVGDGTGPACINEHLFLVRGNKDRIIQEYLYYSLLAEHGQRQIASQISGSAQPGLKSNFLKGVAVSLPDSVDEQSKIAEALSTADRTIEQTEALIAKQQHIKLGLMQDLLTRGVDQDGKIRSDDSHAFQETSLGKIPVEWEVKTLSQIVEVIDCKHYTPDYVDEGIPLIRPRNIKDEGFDLGDLDYVSEDDYALLTDKHEPKNGDIVFSRNASFGTPVYVEGMGRFCIGQDVVIMKKKNVDPRYVFLSLKSDRVVRQILNASAGSTFGRINLAAIRNLRIPLPRLEPEQDAIASHLFAYVAAIRNMRNSLEKLASLKSGLAQDLLSGKRRVTSLLESESI